MSIQKVITGLLLILIHPVKGDFFFRYGFFNMFFVKNRFFAASTRAYTGTVRDGSAPQTFIGGRSRHPPPRTQSFHAFQILNSRVENIKIISLLFIQCKKKIVNVDQSHHHRCPNENLFRMHIHPNRMGAIRDSAVKQLFLILEVVKDHFLFF